MAKYTQLVAELRDEPAESETAPETSQDLAKAIADVVDLIPPCAAGERAVAALQAAVAKFTGTVPVPPNIPLSDETNVDAPPSPDARIEPVGDDDGSWEQTAPANAATPSAGNNLSQVPISTDAVTRTPAVPSPLGLVPDVPAGGAAVATNAFAKGLELSDFALIASKRKGA